MVGCGRRWFRRTGADGTVLFFGASQWVRCLLSCLCREEAGVGGLHHPAVVLKTMGLV